MQREGLSFQRISLWSLWSFKGGVRKEGYDARIIRIDAKFIYNLVSYALGKEHGKKQT